MAREVLPARCIATLESHTGRIEIIPPIFVVSFTLFSPLNINGHMLSGVMAQEVTTAYNTRLLTLFYCLQISSIVFSYTSILSRFPLCPLPSLAGPRPTSLPPLSAFAPLSFCHGTIFFRPLLLLFRGVLLPFRGRSSSSAGLLFVVLSPEQRWLWYFLFVFYDNRFLPLCLLLLLILRFLPFCWPTLRPKSDLCGLLCNRNLLRGACCSIELETYSGILLFGSSGIPFDFVAATVVELRQVSAGNRFVAEIQPAPGTLLDIAPAPRFFAL